MSENDVILIQSGSDDWFVIERAEHENRGWMEAVPAEGYIPAHTAFRWSGRISDADVEGTAVEMLAIADAIERGESARFKRCAALVQPDGAYHLSSPRNSMRPGIVSADQAKQLAVSIRRVLAEAIASPKEPRERAKP